MEKKKSRYLIVSGVFGILLLLALPGLFLLWAFICYILDGIAAADGSHGSGDRLLLMVGIPLLFSFIFTLFGTIYSFKAYDTRSVDYAKKSWIFYLVGMIFSFPISVHYSLISIISSVIASEKMKEEMKELEYETNNSDSLLQ